MDLSQQELPLTTYFTRYSKEAQSRAIPYRDKPTEDSQPVVRSSKRRKSNAQCSTASPSGSSASQSKSRMTTLQLPTPAASTRKRIRSRRLEPPAKTPLTSNAVLSSVERNAILLSKEDTAQPESGPIASQLPQLLREGAKDAISGLSSIPLMTPCVGQRRTTKFTGVEFHPGPGRSNLVETGIPTPWSSSRRITEPVRGIDDRTTLARSTSHLPSKPNQVNPGLSDSEVSHSVSPHQPSARSTAGPPCFPVELDYTDPFCSREKSRGFAQRDSGSAPPKQYSIQSRILDGQPSDDRAIPMIPVPSSQSQYLLHLDATPKRKRCSQNVERVTSSQTQEERELALSTPHRPAVMVNLSVRISPGKHTRRNTRTPRLNYGKRKSQHVYTLGSTPVGSPISSSPGPSRSVFATKKALEVLSSKLSSPSRRENSTSPHSPSRRKSKMPWRFPRHDSIEHIPSAHIEDSLTESESESDILQLRLKCKLSALNLPSRETEQVPPVLCGPAEGNLPGVEDDSATEAESDTEILHCIAEIGKKRPRDYHSEVPRKDTPPPPVISPLVSPARPRIAPAPSVTGSTQFFTQEGAGLSILASCQFYSSTIGPPQRPQMPSESLPSVVQDFIRMFPGDESYPADFPESLRV